MAALLAIDVGFIIVNIAAVLAAKAHVIAAVPEMLKVTHDLALPEDFNYVKWAVIAAALIWLSIRDRWLPPLLWAVVFLMILADDSLQFHETLGHAMSTALDLPSNAMLYGDDLGEVAVFGIMGLIALGLGIAAFSQSGRASRVLGLRYCIVIAGLGFFGVGIDTAHQIIVHLLNGTWFDTVLQQIAGMLED
ncbi:MAG: hypothetical protein ACKO2N_10810, partial [Tabrizicola sp.]